MERKLTAILSADVKGFSRLMGEAEEATLRTLTSHRQLIDSQIAQHRGRIVGTAGDSVLAEFASVVAAVQCAVVIQQTLKAENAQLPAARRMEFRIGINLGDVMVEGDQIYGDGVNIAARLEALVRDETLRHDMGIRARGLIENWSYAQVARGVRAALAFVNASGTRAAT